MASAAPLVAGRYELYGEIASGGMATIYLGRLQGPVGFSRFVAVKRLHPHYAKEAQFVSMFLDEARLAAQVRHPNVVPTLDILATEGELFVVMECVQGESLAKLFKAVTDRGEKIPPRIAAAIAVGMLHGLHAAHEARSARGEPLAIVHRDVSPQNVLVGTDGVSRVLDFGIAKATGRIHETRDGQVKGKLPYMAPEQLRGEPLTRQTDIYAASVVLWETLTGQWCFDGPNDGAIIAKVFEGAVPPPSRVEPAVPRALDEVLRRGLARDKSQRWATAREMAIAIERVIAPASAYEVGDWVERNAGEELAKRAAQIAEVEAGVAALQMPEQSRVLSALRSASEMQGLMAAASAAAALGGPRSSRAALLTPPSLDMSPEGTGPATALTRPSIIPFTKDAGRPLKKSFAFLAGGLLAGILGVVIAVGASRGGTARLERSANAAAPAVSSIAATPLAVSQTAAGASAPVTSAPESAGHTASGPAAALDFEFEGAPPGAASPASPASQTVAAARPPSNATPAGPARAATAGSARRTRPKTCPPGEPWIMVNGIQKFLPECI
jgi:serine/threonine-protein kinase